MAKKSMLPLPEKEAASLLRKFGDAIGNKRFYAAIQAHEKAAQKFNLSLPQKSRLASLYYHIAPKTRQLTKRENYLGKAGLLYREIIKENPDDVHAWRGLGVIAYLHGKSKQAEMLWKRTFRIMAKLPPEKRGALGIGGFYQEKGNLKKTEYWLKKEYALVRDLGTTMNLFLFYYGVKDLKKAKYWGHLTKQLMEDEFKKPQYRQFDVKHNQFFIGLRKKILETESAGR